MPDHSCGAAGEGTASAVRASATSERSEEGDMPELFLLAEGWQGQDKARRRKTRISQPAKTMAGTPSRRTRLLDWA